MSAALGALVRRWLSGVSSSQFIRPLCAAVIAGTVAATAANLHEPIATALVAFCPCMVLVPGPHLLNGAIDLVRTRIALGIARLTWAGIIVLMICSGLFLGFIVGGTSLPVGGPSAPVPFVTDAIAAGWRSASFGTFFSMPWRMLRHEGRPYQARPPRGAPALLDCCGVKPGVWRGSCDAETRAAGLFQIRAFGVPGVKRRYHFGNMNNPAVRETGIQALIVDLGRRAQLLEDDIAAEEKRARVFNHSDAAYPIAARILAVRRDNVKATIAMLEKRLAGLKQQVEQVPA